jgi:hypothetical protein
MEEGMSEISRLRAMLEAMHDESTGCGALSALLPINRALIMLDALDAGAGSKDERAWEVVAVDHLAGQARLHIDMAVSITRRSNSRWRVE